MKEAGSKLKVIWLPAWGPFVKEVDSASPSALGDTDLEEVGAVYFLRQTRQLPHCQHLLRSRLCWRHLRWDQLDYRPN